MVEFPSQRPMDILLIGLGSLGAIYGYAIQKTGMARLTVVARSNLEAVNEHGMNIKSARFGECRGWKPDRIFRTVAEAADRQYDYVILTTKCVPEVLETATLLEPLLVAPFAQPTYMCLQNGLGVEKGIFDALIKLNHVPRIISVAVHIFANQRADYVEHDDYEKIFIGTYRPNDYHTMINSKEELETLNRIGDVLKKGGSQVFVVPEIQRHKFYKNMMNATFNALSLLTGFSVAAIYRPPPQAGCEQYEPFVHPATKALIEEHTVPLIHDILFELLALARAMGFADTPEGISEAEVMEVMDNTRKTFSKATNNSKTSTLVDYEKGVPMEIEVIWGSLVRLGMQFKVEMPHVKMAYGIMLVKQNQVLRVRAQI